jgi:hypothetical protein
MEHSSRRVRLRRSHFSSYAGVVCNVKFTSDRRFADPDAAARKLLDIVRGSINESDLRHAYTGVTNTAFTRAGGSVHEYSIGMKHAAAQTWLRSIARARGVFCWRMARSSDVQSLFPHGITSLLCKVYRRGAQHFP